MNLDLSNQIQLFVLVASVILKCDACLNDAAKAINQQYRRLTLEMLKNNTCLEKNDMQDCNEEYKTFLDMVEVTAEDFDQYCCSIYGYERCIRSIVSKRCGQKASKINKKFSEKLDGLLKNECDGYYGLFACMDEILFYSLIIGSILLVIITIGCCCCCCFRPCTR